MSHKSFILGNIPTKTTLEYRGQVFRVERRGAEFRVYAGKSGLNFVGEGILDKRIPLPRWLIKPAGGKARLLLSSATETEAICELCDRYLDYL